MRKQMVYLGFAAAALLAVGTLKAEPVPWTHRNFLDNPDDFHFAIVPDRAGGDYRGAFTNALAKINLMRPEFVMTVGDLIQGASKLEEMRAQQTELTNMTAKVIPPFFTVVGNHDISRSRTNPPGFESVNEDNRKVWKEYYGENTYYSFVYKKVLFVCLNTMEGRDSRPKQCGITPEQYAWFAKTLDENKDARWTCIFMHQPGVWNTADWIRFEKAKLVPHGRYTVFAGDWHCYYHARRYGFDYYVLSVAGGTSSMNARISAKRPFLLGPEYGEMDHIAWVTMTKDGPVVANLLIDGILPGDYLNQGNSKATVYTTPIDVPPDPKTVERLAAQAKANKEKAAKASRK